VPSKNKGTRIELSLKGYRAANQASADVRAERLRSLSALLPQVSAHGRQDYEGISYKRKSA
jgi:hypothetical protein